MSDTNTPDKESAATSFPKFAKLPVELRVNIWTYAFNDIPPRVVEVYGYNTTRITSGLPAIFHTCRESRQEALKLAKNNFMTLNKDDDGIGRLFYFNYERDTLLLSTRFATTFYGSLALEYMDYDLPFLFKFTEEYRFRVIQALFQPWEISKVQKLAYAPVTRNQLSGEAGSLARFSSLKVFIYLHTDKWEHGHCGLDRCNLDALRTTLKGMFANMAAFNEGRSAPEVRAFQSLQEFLEAKEQEEKAGRKVQFTVGSRSDESGRFGPLWLGEIFQRIADGRRSVSPQLRLMTGTFALELNIMM